MKFVVSSALLSSHLQTISRVINSKNTLPILDCFLLVLKDNKLTITAADSEIRMETFVEVAEHEGEGSLAINSKNLLDPLRELPDQPLTFDINDETLEVHIYYHNGKYNFIGLKNQYNYWLAGVWHSHFGILAYGRANGKFLGLWRVHSSFI